MSDRFPYELVVQRIDGASQGLEDYRGKVLLIVNTASRCGFTPQYEGLEKLYRDFREEGFEVLGFPCNQFGGQEPGSEAQILEFCQTSFDVSFPLFQKVAVNGPGAHPLFDQLKRARPGLLGSRAIKWNFTKFLVGRDGRVLERFAPKDRPEVLARAVRRALSDPRSHEA